jgi:hypothetical protein
MPRRHTLTACGAYNSAGDSRLPNIATAATSQGSATDTSPSVPQRCGETIFAPGCGKPP